MTGKADTLQDIRRGRTRTRRCGRLGCRLLAAVPVLAVAAPAAAELTPPKILPFVTTSVTATDNVDFTPDKRSELLATVSPGIRIEKRGRSVNLDVTVTANGQYAIGDREFSFFGDANVNGLGTFVLVDDLLFVDAAAGASREIIDERRGTSARPFQADGNLVTVQRYLVSPYLRYRFGPDLIGETRTRLGYVTAGDALNDTVELGASQRLSGGPRFKDLPWNLIADYQFDRSFNGGSRSGDGYDVETTTIKGDVEYIINQTWSLLASAGYEAIDDERMIDDISGPIWSVGFRFRPLRRLSITATYGRRYEDDDYSFLLDWNLGARTNLTVGYQRTLETDQQRFLRELSGMTFSEEAPPVAATVDPLTAFPDERSSLRDDVMVREVWSARLGYNGRRDAFSLELFQSDRTSRTTAFEDSSWGGSAAWSHRLNRRTTSTALLGYEHVDFGPAGGREDDRYTLGLGLAYQLSRTAIGAITYTFRYHDSNRDDRDVSENAVIFSLTKTF